MTQSPAAAKAQLRAALGARRRAVSPAEARRAAVTIAARVWRLPALTRARRIACYLAVRGEVDCEPLIAEAWKRGREVYLPVLTGNRMQFALFHRDTPLAPNRFGIPEPVCSPADLRSARALHVILAPLLAFDDEGTRLGMGGGFYDRSLAFLAIRAHLLRPRLIAVAYDFQRVAHVPGEAWDVRLTAAVTEKSVYRFDTSPSAR